MLSLSYLEYSFGSGIKNYCCYPSTLILTHIRSMQRGGGSQTHTGDTPQVRQKSTVNETTPEPGDTPHLKTHTEGAHDGSEHLKTQQDPSFSYFSIKDEILNYKLASAELPPITPYFAKTQAGLESQSQKAADGSKRSGLPDAMLSREETKQEGSSPLVLGAGWEGWEDSSSIPLLSEGADRQEDSQTIQRKVTSGDAWVPDSDSVLSSSESETTQSNPPLSHEEKKAKYAEQIKSQFPPGFDKISDNEARVQTQMIKLVTLMETFNHTIQRIGKVFGVILETAKTCSEKSREIVKKCEKYLTASPWSRRALLVAGWWCAKHTVTFLVATGTLPNWVDAMIPATNIGNIISMFTGIKVPGSTTNHPNNPINNPPVVNNYYGPTKQTGGSASQNIPYPYPYNNIPKPTVWDSNINQTLTPVPKKGGGDPADITNDLSLLFGEHPIISAALFVYSGWKGRSAVFRFFKAILRK